MGRGKPQQALNTARLMLMDAASVLREAAAMPQAPQNQRAQS
jgi:hypothetical protein